MFGSPAENDIAGIGEIAVSQIQRPVKSPYMERAEKAEASAACQFSAV
jgi:hypothetical protein